MNTTLDRRLENLERGQRTGWVVVWDGESLVTPDGRELTGEAAEQWMRDNPAEIEIVDD